MGCIFNELCHMLQLHTKILIFSDFCSRIYKKLSLYNFVLLQAWIGMIPMRIASKSILKTLIFQAKTKNRKRRQLFWLNKDSHRPL